MSTTSHIDEQSNDSKIVSARLFNFAINSANLHSEHEKWLANHVVPVLSAGGTIALLGLASRSGSAAYNQRLSMKRAQTVRGYLNSFGLTRHLYVDAKTIIAKGESYAKLRGAKDGSEDAFERAVLLSAWCKPGPPPVRWQDSPNNPANMVERVGARIYRQKVIEQGAGRVQRYQDGEGGVQLAQLLKNLWGAAARGNSGTNHKKKVYYDYVVTHVEEISETYRHKAISATGYTEYKQTYRYSWGPCTPNVVLVRRSIENGKKTWEFRKTYARKNIWKHTQHPRLGRSSAFANERCNVNVE